MADETPADHVARLVDELRTLPAETGWLEFKEDLEDPDKIGEYVSALSNGAALDDKPCGYVVWEVNDATHEVTETGFRPDRKKKGNEDLVPWLARMTEPQLDLRFDRGDLRGKHVVVLRIPRAIGRPTRFWGKEFVRVGSATKSLAEYPETERALWRIFDATPFESRVAMEHVDGARVVELLDHAAYFKLTARPQPADRAGTLDSLSEAGLIRPDGAGRWDVMNLGAILFAHDLGAFGRLGFKALRVIHYQGRGRTAPAREYPAPKGYAAGFDEVIRTLDAILPRNEVIGPAFRTDVRMYPEPPSANCWPTPSSIRISPKPATARWWRFSRTAWKSAIRVSL